MRQCFRAGLIVLAPIYLTVMCSLFMELVASMEWEHLWLNLVMASPDTNWKVPSEVGLWIAVLPIAGSATNIKPWNFATASSLIPCNVNFRLKREYHPHCKMPISGLIKTCWNLKVPINKRKIGSWNRNFKWDCYV